VNKILLESLANYDGSGELTADKDVIFINKKEQLKMAELPWIEEDISQRVYSWLAKYLAMKEASKQKIQSLSNQLNRCKKSLTQSRLLELLNAEKFNLNVYRSLLQDFEEMENQSLSTDFLSVLPGLQPLEQSFLAYQKNFFRDWSWQSDENKLHFTALESLFEKDLGEVLMLGCGSGRLAYDLVKESQFKSLVCVDQNPLALNIFDKVLKGEEIEIYELSQVAQNIKNVAVKQSLKVPSAVTEIERDKIALIIGDALRAPVKRRAFNSLITPWLIDVLNYPLDHILNSMNNYLELGGRWYFFGSVAFQTGLESGSLSLEEFCDRVAQHGFSLKQTKQKLLPYLNSPLESSLRQEWVSLLCFEKVKESSHENSNPEIVDWLSDFSKDIAKSRNLNMTLSQHKLYGMLLSQIEKGARGIDLVKFLQENFAIKKQEEARQLVKNFLESYWQENFRRAF